jgi:hypothetical protein
MVFGRWLGVILSDHLVADGRHGPLATIHSDEAENRASLLMRWNAEPRTPSVIDHHLRPRLRPFG